MDEDILRKETLQTIEKRISSSGLDVSMAKTRFPMVDGIPQLITLKSFQTGTFYNISFIEGVENTIMGHMADKLMNDYPSKFRAVKINGVEVKNTTDSIKESVTREVLKTIKENFDLTPKDKKQSSRARNLNPDNQGKSNAFINKHDDDPVVQPESTPQTSTIKATNK